MVNGKKYVGYTTRDLELRWKEHLSSSSCCKLLKRALKKYGPKSFTREIVYCSKDHDHTLTVMEPYFVRLYNSHGKYGHGYNANYGGAYNRQGHSPSVSTRRKMSEAGKRRSLRPETGPAISNALKGRKISEEWRSKLSDANKGKKATDETKEKMSLASKGRAKSEQAKENMTVANRRHLYEITFPDGNKVISNSLCHFASQHGLSQSGLSRAGGGHQEHHKGFRVNRVHPSQPVLPEIQQIPPN